MSWVTVSEIEAYTGVTYSVSEALVMSDIIDSVCGFIESYCDTKFTDAVYSQRIDIVDNLFLAKNNVQYMYGVFSGIFKAMEVTPPSAISSLRISEDMKTLSLISTFSKTDINISALTLTGAVSAINAITGWSATINSNIVNTYALTLYPGTYKCDINNYNIIEPLCANVRLSATQLTNQLFFVEYTCSDGICIYQGGYATIPADLLDATIRMCIRAYGSKQVALSGNVKSESVGDFSYTLFTGSEEGTGVDINYYSVLDNYRRFTI